MQFNPLASVLRRAGSIGAPPGTIVADPNAHASSIQVMAYSATDFTEAAVDEIDQISSFLRKWPVTWINVNGLGNIDVIHRLGDLFGLHRLALEDVEPFLYVQRRIRESQAEEAARATEGESVSMRSSTAFHISGMMPLANGHVQLTVTNAIDLVEIYATTVWHTSSVAVVTWTNDLDEVVTSTNELWHAVSPSFSGIESDWVLLTSSLGTTNGVGVYVDTDIPSDGRIRMYAAAQRVDSDGDGISDGEEIFLYRTDPHDPADFPIIPELEAALAEVNTAQLWYLNHLTGGASPQSSGPLNYAQQIADLRNQVESLLPFFLGLDENEGGDLAEEPEVVTWTLPSVLASVGNLSETWLGGMAAAAQVQEIAAVFGELTHLVHVAGDFPGYPYAPVPFHEQEWMVGDWDLGTGYPPNWPHSQPISTYLLFRDMVEFPNAGWGTVDDYFVLNSTSFLDEYIYRKHVADISAPIWNPDGSNVLQLWDCGNCAGTNNHAYLSPFSVVHVMEVPIIKVETIQHKIGTATEWRDFNGPQKILLGKEAHLLATNVQPQEFTPPAGRPLWEGTFGVTESGLEVSHTFSGTPSASDTDTRTVKTEWGPGEPEEFLVCTKVLGVHSNVEPDAGFTAGHAWVSVTDYSSGSPVTTTLGLWPDSHPNVPDNGPDSDVRIGMEPASGLHNRYFLLSPSQYSAFVTFVQTHAEWGYTYTCANWAEDAYEAGTGETVDSSDWVIFGTPRKISASIIALETDHPTTSDMPYDGGEDAESTSSGSSWGGSSFVD